MDPPNTRVWRDVPPLASSPRIITQKPWSRRGTIGKNGRWICGRSAAPTGSASPRFPSKLEKRGNARLRPHTHRPRQQGELIIDDSKNHTRPAERTNGVHVKSVDTKSPIQACPKSQRCRSSIATGRFRTQHRPFGRVGGAVASCPVADVRLRRRARLFMPMAAHCHLKPNGPSYGKTGSASSLRAFIERM